MDIRKILLAAIVGGVLAPSAAMADDYVDDIYFNPKKDKTVGAQKKKQSNYIENFSDMDVDTYNLRGQYYNSPIDTVGSRAGSEDDFVYTQQIQKFYNPTIVLDNSNLLADVLENSYGNVEIVFNGLTPAFAPSYAYGWPYYRSYYDPWVWNVGFGGWYDPWYWGPSWSWNWGPSWAWGPSYAWGWGPSWAWGPSYGWGWGPSWGWSGVHHHPHSNWRPAGNRPGGAGPGWATSTRPGRHRPAGTNSRPGGNTSSSSKWGIGNSHRTWTGTGNRGTSSSAQSAPGSNRGSYTIGSDGHRYRGSSNSSGSSGTVNQGSNSGNSHRTSGSRYGSSSSSESRGSSSKSYTTNSSRESNSSRSTGNSNRSYNSNSSRSSGNGSFGSGSFGGGSRSSGGGSRSGGGGGRGGRR